MDVERETLVEAGVSIAVVGVFVLVLMGIGLTYGGEGGDQLGDAGAMALIASIAAFVVVMGVVGYLLNRYLDDEEE